MSPSPADGLPPPPEALAPEWCRTPTLEALAGILAKAAASGAPCLIWGESGVGKNCFAWLYHILSPHHDGPCEELSCASLPDSLLETELFGYVRGAYTGADKNHPGRIRRADGGTLVLDELESLSPSAQAKLLRVVETGEFTPLGSERQARVDARFIGLLQRSPEILVAENRLRGDLYYRMSLFSLEVPPLRKRRAEIPVFLHYFLRNEAARLKTAPPRPTPPALAALQAYAFPGNLRELRNMARRWTMLRPGLDVRPEDLPFPSAGVTPSPAVRKLADVEEEQIRLALEASGGRKSEAARLLGIHRKTLLEKRKRYGLE